MWEEKTKKGLQAGSDPSVQFKLYFVSWKYYEKMQKNAAEDNLSYKVQITQFPNGRLPLKVF